MTELHFTKMHGCGNDYIYFDCMDDTPQSAYCTTHPEQLAQKLSDRHFGIGGDGVVLICPAESADARMRMFNADGSEGNMCGNAIRCVGKYLYDIRGIKKDVLTVDTRSGIKTLQMHVTDGTAEAVTVAMGKAELDPKKIPVLLEGDAVINRRTPIAQTEANITCVSMGNPHNVLFVEDPYAIPLEQVGPLYENDPLFPDRVNTEFVRVIGDNCIQMRVWERGSGETWACGTGACAAAVASVLCGYCKKNEDITVKLRGGDLTIRYTDDQVYMRGSATVVFCGTVTV